VTNAGSIRKIQYKIITKRINSQNPSSKQNWSCRRAQTNLWGQLEKNNILIITFLLKRLDDDCIQEAATIGTRSHRGSKIKGNCVIPQKPKSILFSPLIIRNSLTSPTWAPWTSNGEGTKACSPTMFIGHFVDSNGWRPSRTGQVWKSIEFWIFWHFSFAINESFR
jgi:hypothetical protein